PAVRRPRARRTANARGRRRHPAADRAGRPGGAAGGGDHAVAAAASRDRHGARDASEAATARRGGRGADRDRGRQHRAPDPPAARRTRADRGLDRARGDDADALRRARARAAPGPHDHRRGAERGRAQRRSGRGLSRRGDGGGGRMNDGLGSVAPAKDAAAKPAHLKVEGLSAGYGAFLVLRELSLEARPGVTVILGPNGAGKTTLLKAIAGLLPRAGRVLLDGDEIARNARPSEIVGRGLAMVAEGRQLFPQMTVRENLELGGWLVSPSERALRIEQAFRSFPRLGERAEQLAGTMSGGEQQMVAVARAMMSAPRLLLLDEPSLGLAPKMVDELLAIARRIADQGTTVLMVEQNVRKSLAVA